ncbi:MAG: hypothetical protein IJ224_08625 [Lachnospiraceae bacterium]|nr:hypothetical protein [Lachnospiraceae bacterium]
MSFEVFIEEIKSDNEIPEVVDSGIKEALSNLAKKNNQKNNINSAIRYKRFVMAFTIFLVCVFTLSVSAQTFIYWSGSIEDRFVLNLFDKDILENGGFAVNPSMTRGEADVTIAEYNGVVISVTQTVADSNNIVIGLQITGLEDYAKSELIPECEVLIDGKSIPHVSAYSFIYDSEKGYGETYIEILYNSGDEEDVESIIGKRIAINVKGIATCDNLPTVQGFNYVVEGEWQLEWTMSGGEEKREWNLSKDIGDTGIVLIYARITPISIYLRFKADDTVGASAEGFGEKHNLYGIKFSDGSIRYNAISEGEYGLAFEKDYDYYMNYYFNNIVNPEDISALLFIKEVPINYENPSEDEYYVIGLD